MSVKDQIDNVLFKIGQEIKIHKIDSDNTIIEIDYDRYSNELLRIFEEYKKLERKTVVVDEFQPKEKAKEIINQAIERYRDNFK